MTKNENTGELSVCVCTICAFLIQTSTVPIPSPTYKYTCIPAKENKKTHPTNHLQHHPSLLPQQPNNKTYTLAARQHHPRYSDRAPSAAVHLIRPFPRFPCIPFPISQFPCQCKARAPSLVNVFGYQGIKAFRGMLHRAILSQRDDEKGKKKRKEKKRKESTA